MSDHEDHFDSEDEAEIVNPSRGIKANPKIKILVGNFERAFIVSIKSLFVLSPIFAKHVLLGLPKRDRAILCPEMHDEVFECFCEFERLGYYITFPGPLVKNPKDRPFDAKGDAIAAVKQRIFAKRVQHVYSIKGWTLLVARPEVFRDETLQKFAKGILDRYHNELSQSPYPTALDEHVLFLHGDVYAIAAKYKIEKLRVLARKMLLRVIYEAHLTYDFVGSFSQTVEYLLWATPVGDEIRGELIRFCMLTGFIFSPHPQFLHLLDNNEEVRKAVLGGPLYYHFSASCS
ncbi:uncharacterized protein F4822DRAFT_355524 [Hypoxylon trugodes]|uniref:uncharacterized protein n=1 Tax=Hypoxylon trugodes TaxID=326681 RepID=UPI00219E168D|nr:uncharacterized protein F4822DRAFT_355524 [Hypoxylon trugodes]KAI1385823.1 hypothetical protein F4822DRAFT_355524 [Hypoxylon trugodes]